VKNLKSYPKTLKTALAVAAAMLAASPALAWYSNPSSTWADGQLVDVQVRVAGQAAPLYLSPKGDGRQYVQAYAGRNYSLVVRNNSGERVGVLIAVDGLNVVNGERTNMRAGEAMYVLGPWESATIDGWRTSLDDVQKFVFVDEHKSYAARTGQANGDMGWIRVNAFREQRTFWQPRGLKFNGGDRHDYRGENQAPNRDEPMADAAPAPELSRKAMPSAPMAESRQLQGEQSGGNAFPGTGWGQHQYDHVNRVQFTAQSYPTDQLVFRYEYASGLRALGIFPNRDRLRDRDNGELGFAKPPVW
jgi:hypothetical protein